MKVQLFIAAAAAALCAASAASAAPEVEIENAVARVVVIPEARSDIAVDVRQGRADLPQLTVSQRGGGKVEIDGDLDRRIQGCNYHGGASTLDAAVNPPENLVINVRGLPPVKLADAPLITLRVPMDVNIDAGGAVFGSIGRSDSLELGAAGCGDWTVANSKGEMKISVAGSGDVAAGTSASLQASIAGSGDVRTGATQALRASIAGSGDVRVARVDGPIDASIAGSGDVSVDAGRASRLKASIAGSGDVRFGGTADTLNASVIGSGDVRVGAVTGSISKSVMGSGDVVVGR
ncbi:GIN domain-containing protein [Caulobacter sp. 17J80-11]|uniref:GIN domain-containing protein n=1 Tax=Caulobacter sp. 17J80-11 TaxID=2763502 RepID=UPI001653E4DB|nr:DUF2807 domain-containing protein [Caulobacter sp. 17J80-11]MBC6980614.1 DUF2807 domain-containing protein [Caulobacter sp. 17J80-11]